MLRPLLRSTRRRTIPLNPAVQNAVRHIVRVSVSVLPAEPFSLRRRRQPILRSSLRMQGRFPKPRGSRRRRLRPKPRHLKLLRPKPRHLKLLRPKPRHLKLLRPKHRRPRAPRSKTLWIKRKRTTPRLW